MFPDPGLDWAFSKLNPKRKSRMTEISGAMYCKSSKSDLTELGPIGEKADRTPHLSWDTS